MNYDQIYFERQKRRRIPIILQLTFLTIGTLLIIVFAIIVNKEKPQADTLLSPLVDREEKSKQIVEYSLVYADNKKVIYKEIENDKQTLKLLNISTALNQTLGTANRLGFIGFLNSNILLYLVDEAGNSQFTINKYDITEKTIKPILSFQSIKSLSLKDLDYIVSLSLDKSKLAITHATGIVIYTINSEKETTPLENENCLVPTKCIIYKNPFFLNDSKLLVYQETENKLTPIIVSSLGKIQAVLKDAYELNPSEKGLPLVGILNGEISTFEQKSSVLVLAQNNSTYQNPVWIDKNIAAFSLNQSGIYSLIKTDIRGKDVVNFMEFPQNSRLLSLTKDPQNSNIFFLNEQISDKTITINFYKLDLTKDNQPQNFYSISKNI